MLRRRELLLLSRRFSSRVVGEKVETSEGNSNLLRKEDIDDVIKVAPTLLSVPVDLWQRSHDVFSNHGLSKKEFLKIIVGNPNVLTRSPKKIIDSIEAWRNCQFGEQKLYQLLVRYPFLFDVNYDSKIMEKVTFLRKFVGSTKNVWTLLMNSPNLIKESNEAIEEKFDYLTKVMRIEIPEIIKSEVFSRSLDEIKTRHIFLERLGLFKARSPKADPNEPSKNHKLFQIMDTSDKAFATKVAGVTLMEFESFQELYKRELDTLQHGNQDEWSDDDT